MSKRFPVYGLPVLIVALSITAACNGTNSSLTAPAAAQSESKSLFAVEPATLRPEPVSGSSCSTVSAFGTRLGVVVRGTEDLILRNFRFQLTDRLGVVAFPEVIPIPSLTAQLPARSIPTSSAIPFPGGFILPSTSAIPIPGSLPIEGTLVSRGASRTFPFFLRFGCGVLADGTLLIVVDAADGNGRFKQSELRVRVGG